MVSTPVQIPWWFTEFTEDDRDRLLEAFDSRRFSLGRVTAELERALAEFLGVPHVVATQTGTAALTMSLLAVGVRPGDEVIVPDLTWIATAQAVSATGATPVPADSLPDATLLDPADVERRMTPRTRAVLPVHLNGRACDIDALSRLIEGRNTALIEDACKAMGSRPGGRTLGTLGEVGCFSMGLVSLVSAGYGGFAATRDAELAERMRLIRDHGVSRSGADEALALPGFNFKISDLLSALASGHLERVEQKSTHLRAIHRRYAEGLAGLEGMEFLSVALDQGELPLLAELSSPSRESIVIYLEQHGVQTSRYHPPVHSASYLGSASDAEYPNATRQAAEGLILPCGPSQPLERVDRVIELLQSFAVA